jgi:anaerobic magnesium-protoporphyrin IX monomethyl ester cyclase
MKATLIFPGITLCGWGRFGRPDGGGDANFVQYGLAYIAAFAKQKGHDIDLVDLRKLAGWEDFDAEIRRRAPAVFGLSATSVDFPVAREAARRVKRIDPRSITVIGGVHATVRPEEVAAVEAVDHIVTGEGEIAFEALLDRIGRNLSSPRVLAGSPADIAQLPHPDRELFDFRSGELAHPWLPHMPAPFVSIVTSRGCPFHCKFCQPAERRVFGDAARLRPIDDVMAELAGLRERYHFKSLLIHDDLFTFNRKRVREFCRRYRGGGFTAAFTCQARADFVAGNADLIREMAETGLSCLMIGFESGSQRILDFIGKGTTVAQNYRAAEICRRHGVKIFANYMFGIPTETAEDVKRTVELIRAVQPDYCSPTVFTPYFGTELYAYCREKGLLLESSGAFFSRAPDSGRKIRSVDYDLVRYAIEQTRRNAAENRAPAAASATVRSIGWPARALQKFRELRRSLGVKHALGRAARYLRRQVWNQWYGLRYRF